MTIQVSVTPEDFDLVDYEPEPIAAVAREIGDSVGLPDRFRLGVEVDETSPMGTVTRRSLDADGAAFVIESGAFEDPKRPRQFGVESARETFGRTLFRVIDLISDDFGYNGPEDETDLGTSLVVAWDVYSLGRFARSGFKNYRDRMLYHFRVRHGFTDAGDARFEALWNGQDLTFEELAELAAIEIPIG